MIHDYFVDRNEDDDNGDENDVIMVKMTMMTTMLMELWR